MANHSIWRFFFIQINSWNPIWSRLSCHELFYKVWEMAVFKSYSIKVVLYVIQQARYQFCAETNNRCCNLKLVFLVIPTKKIEWVQHGYPFNFYSNIYRTSLFEYKNIYNNRINLRHCRPDNQWKNASIVDTHQYWHHGFWLCSSKI